MVYFINRTNKTTTIQLQKFELRKTWAYGGGDPMPKELMGPKKMKPADFFSIPPEAIPKPQEFKEAFKSAMEIAPYSMTVAEVQSKK